MIQLPGSVRVYLCLTACDMQCQRISGRDLDRSIGELLVATVNPLNLEVALAIQRELQSRLEDVDRLRRQVVHRAQ